MAGGGVRDSRDYVVWTVTNAGRRSIVVEHVGGEYQEKDKHFILVPHGKLPRELKPYDTFTEYGDDLASLQNLKSLCVWDTLGRIYRAPRKKLDRVRKELAKGGNENRGTIAGAVSGASKPAIPPEENY
jgi:hypothetical protein